MSANADRRRRAGRWTLIAGVAAGGVVCVAVLGMVVAITGAGLACRGGGADDAGGASRVARSEIPNARLMLYRAAGRRFDLDWAFLAAVGAQECRHGSCAGENDSGCAGSMQIAYRRHSPCSPGEGPTLWERYAVDGDGDGRADIDDPADAIFTAARILREAKGAPAVGGSRAAYRRAACNYYGACSDALAHYADDVMARAIAYGLGRTFNTDAPGAGDGCAASLGVGAPVGDGGFGVVVRRRAPRQLAAVPSSITIGGTGMRCDARIVEDVTWLARRFHVLVTACYAIHSPAGEHPLGAAVDLIPEAGYSWQETTEALARTAGWHPACARVGGAPECAAAPFRFVGYNGYPGHGDPTHCGCGSGAHLHLSWQTSASEGQPENRSRNSYFAASWIDVFTTDDLERAP